MNNMPIQVRLRPGFLVFSVLMSVASFGFFAIVFAFMWIFVFPFYPRCITREGIELRGGQFVKWSNLTRTEGRTVTAAGLRVTGTRTLWFGKQKVVIAPMAVRPAQEIVAAVECNTGLCAV